MHETDRARIRAIKAWVAAMLEERAALANAGNPLAAPSRYWSDFCSYFDYLPGLPEESFARLRLHTYHLTADNYQTYFFGDREQFLARLDGLVEGLPPAYRVDEPEGGIGFRYPDGRFLSVDSVRFQRVVTSLHRRGVLARLLAIAGRRRRLLEIGAGYGGLAHHLSRIGNPATYVIVDLPETLLFSASYLTLLNPQKKIYLYEPDSLPAALRPEHMASCDFLLVPNYRVELLADLRFDLVVNVASFQEMRRDQVEAYLDFVRAVCTGTLYSWNQDHQERNYELPSLLALLAERFDVEEVPDWTARRPRRTARDRLREALRGMATAVGLLDRPPATVVPPYREYLCTPRRDAVCGASAAGRRPGVAP